MRKLFKRLKLIFRIKRFIPFLIEFFRSSRVTLKKKLVVIAAIIGYFMLPFDIIPDYLTIFGIIDDFAILMIIFQQMIKSAPEELKEKHGLIE